MKRFICYIISFLCCSHLFAQKDQYIFIQQGSGQPFYVRMGEKSFSSSSGGHIILSDLQDAVYNLYIGFPKNAAPEQLFSVTLNRKDRGFELKNVNGEWQLFDLQSLEFIRAASDRSSAGTPGEKKSDSYSQLMAGVVNDSAVLYTIVAKKEVPVPEVKGTKGVVVKKEPAVISNTRETKKKATVPPAAKELAVKEVPANDSARVNDPMITKDTPAINTAVKEQVTAPKDIFRYGSENTEEGKLIIYIDRTSPVSDTIRIVIPRI
jgi:hypothetical protein